MMSIISTSPPETADRFARQQDFVPRGRLVNLTVTVIGVGAIGRQVALQVACLGVPRLTLVDFDLVEPTNATTQGYVMADVGQSKVGATAAVVRAIDPMLAVTMIEDRYRPSLDVGEVVFCCVDSISVRTAIWRSAGRTSRFWGDGRMLGEVIRVLCVADDEGRRHYPTTLFAQEQAVTGRCTARGTVYTANIAAGLLLHQFSRWLRKLPIAPDQTLNLLASELVTTESCLAS